MIVSILDCDEHGKQGVVDIRDIQTRYGPVYDHFIAWMNDGTHRKGFLHKGPRLLCPHCARKLTIFSVYGHR